MTLGESEGEELGDFADAVADDVVHELAGEGADPVFFVAEKGLGVAFVGEVVTEEALHVGDGAAEEAGLDQVAHFHGGVAELVVVAGGEFGAGFEGQGDEFLGLGRGDGKGFFQKHAATVLDADFAHRKVGLRGSGDVADLRLGLAQHGLDVGEPGRDVAALGQLTRHQFFAVAGADQLAPLGELDGGGVFIGDFAAANYCHSHGFF